MSKSVSNRKKVIFIFCLLFLALIIFLISSKKSTNEQINVTNQQLIERLQLSKKWFLNNTEEKSGLMQYQYHMATDSYSKDNNHLRQLATLWAITQLDQLFKDDSLTKLTKNILQFYLKFKVTEEEGAQINIEGQSPLSINAFMILSLLNVPSWPQKDKLLSEFSQGILNQQQGDGSYLGVDNYSGEAMLALMKLYLYKKDDRYLDSVKKAFPYYLESFRKNKNAETVPYLTQSFFLIFQETQNKEIADFIFEINDWLIDNERSPLGSVYIESINDAYALSKLLADTNHQQKYVSSIKKGVDFILKTQTTNENTMKLKNPYRAIGGFSVSINGREQRVDYTQHAIFALTKTLQNRVADDQLIQSNSQKRNQINILMKNQSFKPNTLTIKKGDKVTFVNEDNKSYWPASDIHPTHSLYPEFDSKKPVKKGERWSIIFFKAGNWSYHDHINPAITGNIIVTE